MKSSDQPSFDLITEPWLPVRTTGNHREQVSLVDLIARAHELAALSGELPTQTFALLRLVLAVLHRAIGGPRDTAHWAELWASPVLPHEQVARYLDGHRERFDLFHPRTPFFQVADLHTSKGETSELNKLIADVPNGNPFFTTRLGGDLSLDFAEAARWVVHAQAFDTSGIKSGAVGDPRVKNGKGYPMGAVAWSGQLGAVLPEGATLKETLLLNLLPHDTVLIGHDPDGDRPAWERAHLGAAEEDPGRPPTGPLDLYTWQSRRIRLVPVDGEVRSVLICNGDLLKPQNRFGIEPHTGWRRSKNQERQLKLDTVYMPREHDPERAIWRGLEAMLPGGAAPPSGAEASDSLLPAVVKWIAEVTDEVLGQDYPVRLRAIGMAYGSQNSVVDDVLDDTIALRSELLGRARPQLVETVFQCVRDTDQAAWALGRLALTLAQAGGKLRPSRGIPEPGEVGHRDRAIELAYAELDVEFRRWLSRLGPASDAVQVQADWHGIAASVLRRLARQLLAQAPPAAWAGRLIDGRLVTSAGAEARFSRELKNILTLAHRPNAA